MLAEQTGRLVDPGRVDRETLESYRASFRDPAIQRYAVRLYRGMARDLASGVRTPWDTRTSRRLRR